MASVLPLSSTSTSSAQARLARHAAMCAASLKVSTTAETVGPRTPGAESGLPAISDLPPGLAAWP